MKTNVIIGCGGVGSWLAPAMEKLMPGHTLLVDGDTVEPGNLDRQLFEESAISQNKAKVLAEKYHTEHRPNWFHLGMDVFDGSDTLLVCVDNRRARLAALEVCDRDGCLAIFAANEKHSAEAYYYQPEWQGTRLDPRVMYPEILTDHNNDPMARAIGCTGEAQMQTPQLVSANFMAAGLAQHLYVVWVIDRMKLNSRVIPHLPHKLVSNYSKLETHKVGAIERTNDTAIDQDQMAVAAE